MIEESAKAFWWKSSPTVLGTALSQSVSAISLPFISRMYSIEILALAATFTALSSIAAPILALRFEMLIPRCSGIDEARTHYRFTNKLGVINAILFGASFTLASIFFPMSPLTPLSVALIALGGQRFSSGVMWLLYQRNYRKLMVLLVLNPMVQFGIQIPFALKWPSIHTLVIGYGLSGVIAAYFADGKSLTTGPRWTLLSQIRKHLRFSLFSTGSSLLSTLSSQGWILIIALVLDSKWLVFTSLTLAGIGGPLSFLSSSVANASYAEVQTLDRETVEVLLRRLRIFSLATALSSVLILLGGVLGARAFADELLGDNFKDLWIAVAVYGVPISIHATVSGYGILPELFGLASRAFLRDILRVIVMLVAGLVSLMLASSTSELLILVVISSFQVISSFVFVTLSLTVTRSLKGS